MVEVAPDHSNGVYRVGETVRWRVEWKDASNAPAANYVFLSGGFTNAGKGELQFTNCVAELTSTFSAPGTMLLEVKAKSTDSKEQRVVAGAVAAPEKIPLSATRPDDFDAFWKSKVEELQRVPANPKLESVDIGKTNIAYWKISMDNIRETHIKGQLARPTSGEKFPALLIVQWAGVYPLQKNWATDRAAEGWLVLNIEAHDLPIDEPESFYKEQFAGPLKNYWSIGNTNRETSYFLRMYLSCYRAAEYLSQREDWDGKTLVVMGGSQGGMQALMTAGFFPKITAAMASVPAGCDTFGPELSRTPGWPQWYFKTEDGRNPEQVREASRYFDVANFAAHIKCPVLISAGLIDEVCPPAGILAAANQISSPKEIIILPRAGHQDENDSHGAYNRRCYGEWLPALQKGKLPH